jgi:hypothetical protein
MDELIYSNKEGFVFSDYVILNSFNKKFFYDQMRTIRISKRRSHYINILFIIGGIILLGLYFVFAYDIYKYFSLMCSVISWYASGSIKIYNYAIFIEFNDGEELRKSIKKNQKENYKILVQEVIERVKA